MKIFVASKNGQGIRDNDFSWTREGEPVRFAGACHSGEKADDPCGCGRAVSGFETHKATTTFTVKEVKLTQLEYKAMLLASLKKGGWLKFMNEREVRHDLKQLMEMAKLFEVGAILEYRDGKVSQRNKIIK